VTAAAPDLPWHLRGAAALVRGLYRMSPPSIRLRLKNRVPPGCGSTFIRLLDGTPVLFDHIAESKILTRFFWKDIEGYEAASLRLFECLARRADMVLDIGANFGLYALVAAKANGSARVHAFEPVPTNGTLLRHLATLNGVSDRVSLHAVALSDHAGTATLSYPARRRSHRPTTGSLHPVGVASSIAPGETESLSVRLLRLDEWRRAAEVTPDLIKLDVERAEIDVLRGDPGLFSPSDSGRPGLASGQPDILFEVMPGESRSAEAVAQLADWGYSLYAIERVPADGFRLVPYRTTSHSPIPLSDLHFEVFATCRPGADLARIVAPNPVLPAG